MNELKKNYKVNTVILQTFSSNYFRNIVIKFKCFHRLIIVVTGEKLATAVSMQLRFLVFFSVLRFMARNWVSWPDEIVFCSKTKAVSTVLRYKLYTNEQKKKKLSSDALCLSF